MQEINSYLKGKINLREVPFSFPGSRLSIFRKKKKNSLTVYLAERLIEQFPGIESYLNRKAFIDEISFIDGKNRLVKITESTSPDQILIDSQIGSFNITFSDECTLQILLPANIGCGVKLKVHSSNWKEFAKGGIFQSYRDLVVKCNAEIKKSSIQKQKDWMILNLVVDSKQDSFITLSIGENLIYDEIKCNDKKGIEDCRRKWLDWFQKAPKVDPRYQETYYFAWWVLGNNIISPKGNIHFYTAVPSKKSYVGAWLWDNALHAIALRHVDPGLARDQIRTILDHQLNNGMLPDAIFDDGIVTEIDHPIKGSVTKPPILAWSALKIHDIDPNIEFIREIYFPLKKWNKWWFDQNDDGADGIVQYNHPYSSGLDDHPIWDWGMPVDSPDINTYLFLQMQALAEMALILGWPDESEIWKRKSEVLLKRMLEILWDEESGYFCAKKDGKRLPVFTIVNLLPLWTGVLPLEINQQIICHLTDPSKFWGKYILPTVARDDRKYEQDVMWRGPVWANINYFFIEALLKINENDLSLELRNQTLELVSSNKGIYEYYNSESGKPGFSAAQNFGWSAAVFIDLAIQASKK